MLVLIAGGAGFIGSHLADSYLADGHDVTIVDNLSSGSFSNVPGRALFVLRDVSDRDMRERFSEAPFDVVIHLASPASPTHYLVDPLGTLAANSSGTLNLLELANAKRARFIYASTSEVYGDPLVHPQPETYFGNVDPIGVRSCYDEGKRFGEALTMAYRRTHGLRTTILRIFNTYGPRMRLDDGRVIPAFLDACLNDRPMPIHGDGTQTRSFMFISDLVDAIRLVEASGNDADGLVLNVGNPEEVTVLELAARIAVDLDADYLPEREGDPKQRRPDIAAISTRFGWAPKVSLAEGLRRTIIEGGLQ
jgi:dTDP-glucose 4,6-dehydratase